MSDANRLTTVEQKTIDFYGDALMAVRAADGHIYYYNATLPKREIELR
jgi:hypothetical protein